MFKRRALITEDLLQGEQSVHDAILKLTTARAKANALLMRWGSGEENPLIFSLFTRLAELQWMYNEATKQMAEKHLELSKALKRVFQEEKMVDESRKDLHSASGRKAKLQKQIEVASKKGDHIKAQSLEVEFNTQCTLCDNLTSSVDTKVQKMELYKISQLKKALVCQAEGVITLSGHCQQLYASQMQLIDLLPDSPLEGTDKKEEVDHCMSGVVSKVSELLDLHPPPCAGVDLKNTHAEHTEKTIIGGFLKRYKSADNLNTVEPKPRPKADVRPEVNYTEGMYCEIVIPEPGQGECVPFVHSKGVPMRRCQSGSSPTVSRKVSEERHRSAIVFGKEKEAAEQFSAQDSDSETISIPDTSSEDLPLEEPEQGYARLTILTSPVSQRSSSGSPEVDPCNGYAKPADVLPFEPFNYSRQQKTGKRGATRSPPIPEAKSPGPYESVEDIRKLKREQLNEANRRKGLSPHSSKVDLVENGKNYKDDDHIYSRPFDAVSVNSPLKVSTGSTKDKLAVAPPLNKRLYPNEKSVKSFHQTTFRSGDENVSPSLEPGSRAAKGRSHSAKKVKTSNSAPLFPPPVPPKSSKDEDRASASRDKVLVELGKKLHLEHSESTERRFTGRMGSTGSIRNIPVLPVAEKISKLRTGQATIIKRPIAIPRQ